MRKIFIYCLGVLFSCLNCAVFAGEKFEILPELPEVANNLIPSAQAGSVTNNIDFSSLGIQSVGQEPSAISVIFSLMIVILLIYITGILYSKFNKIGLKSYSNGGIKDFKSRVSVESTLSLGNNKTLHVVELDGKRMLIGASSNSIQLIKDLGNSSENIEDTNYSHIEIPNIKIPKIEIPKIEIPFINFSKLSTKTHKPIKNLEDIEESFSEEASGAVKESDSTYYDNDEVIETLFSENIKVSESELDIDIVDDDVIASEGDTISKHVVNPEEFELHKKYLI